MLEITPSFWTTVVLLLLHQQIVIEALPASLLKHIELNDKNNNNKVKRTTNPEKSTEIIGASLNSDIPYFRKPTKRNQQPLVNIKNPTIDEQNLNEWQQSLNNKYDSSATFDNVQSPLFNDDNDKSIADYEKGYQYGINKEKLDEALENAILKSELYGDQSAVNQYRYYGGEDKRRRRRRRRRNATANLKIQKREAVDLTPEQVLAILSLYENQRSKSPLYYDNEYNNDENWLSRPVAPHATTTNDIPYNNNNNNKNNNDFDNELLPYNYYNNNYNKRFKVARKRVMDPTRELHYWSQQQLGGATGNNKNDYYALAQLLSHQQRAPLHQDVPVYQRLLL